MSDREPTSLPIALRVYPEPKNAKEEFEERHRKWRRSKALFVLDTETRTDHAQRLTFGSYRFLVSGRCVKERLFCADDLPAEDRRTLKIYAKTTKAKVVKEGLHELVLLTRSELVEEFYGLAYKGRCLVTAFNLPFDLSRVAFEFTNARKRFAGGFSLGLSSYIDKNGCEVRDRYRPRIAIKHIDSKRALKGFTGREEPDEADLIPEGSITGQVEEDYVFRGNFLDLRTLAYALTDKKYTLEQACKDFGVQHGKQRPKRHGFVTKTYVKYNRRDVLATSELAIKLLEEYDKHPISLQATKAYSPAAIGKAYLRAMGIDPILERQPNFPKRFLGHAQSAFYGGRTSAHVRKVAVPIRYVDFRSMYPTVNSLMDLWRFVTAREIRVVEHCQEEIEAFLGQLNADLLFDPSTWKHLIAFVQVVPDGDILPSRTKYTAESNDWQVAVNHLYSNGTDSTDGLWWSLPDVVASVLLNNGRIPRIIDAFSLEANGILDGLNATKLRGRIDVDPAKQDFFKVVIEERNRLPLHSDLSEIERKRLDKALKVLANATSYGIYAEMHRLESDHKQEVTCYGIDSEPFQCRVAHPDEAGNYCFPPVASLITGAARLMLTLLEYCVEKLDGTYAMEDTDSMALVATERGGMIPCPGGRFREHGREAVKALSWKQVDDISARFSALNPYDRDAVKGSILKIEDDNRDPKTGKPRQIYCVAISAKRYALFVQDEKGHPTLLREGMNNGEDRWSEHGLGHLLNPSDPESEDRDWIAQVWLDIVRKALGCPTQAPSFEDRPAVGRLTISSPAVMRPLRVLNEEKAYSDQIKPFNFLITCHVKAFGHPPGVKPERFHLIAPYESDARKWLKMDWIDQYSKDSEKRYRITTVGQHGTRYAVRVKTYADVVREYEVHPESKCADATGDPCDKQTIGLLQRRHVRIEHIKYVGKESNSLEEVEAGLIHSAENVYTEYPDRRRDEWETKVRPALKKIPVPILMKMSGKSRSTIFEWLAGCSRPHRKNRELLASIVRTLGLI